MVRFGEIERGLLIPDGRASTTTSPPTTHGTAVAEYIASILWYALSIHGTTRSNPNRISNTAKKRNPVQNTLQSPASHDDTGWYRHSKPTLDLVSPVTNLVLIIRPPFPPLGSICIAAHVTTALTRSPQALLRHIVLTDPWRYG